ncbi:MAG TPA: hypothetical protein VFQ88_12800 [Nevskiaceae bacterium]|nr:hypothetical protein [Nevskiaceae bacterium]
MKHKLLNAVMLLVVIVLAIGVYFASRPKPKVVKPPLTALNSAQIHTITIEKPGHKILELERHKGVWSFTTPIKVQASSANIQSILSVATAECQSEIQPSQVKLANLGLASPKYSVSFNDTKIEIGGTEPLKFRRYAMTGGRICLITDPSAPGLGSENYANLVSTALVPTGRTLVKIAIPGYTVTHRSGTAKEPAGWKLAPADPEAAKNAASTLAQAWQNAHALWNTLMSASTKVPAKAEYATLTFKDGSTLRYLVATRKPQLKLQRPGIGIEFDLSGTETAKLLQPAPETKPKKADEKASPVTPKTAGARK